MLEQRVQTVPPWDVVTVFVGAVVVGVGVVVVGDGGPTVVTGPLLPFVVGGSVPSVEVGPPGPDGPDGPVVAVLVGEPPVVVVDGVEDDGPRGVVGLDDGTVEPSARSTPCEDSFATPGGATRFATLPTAANASPTLAETPSTQRQVRTSPRRTQRLSPIEGAD